MASRSTGGRLTDHPARPDPGTGPQSSPCEARVSLRTSGHAGFRPGQTEAKRAEAQLRASRTALRSLATRQQAIREDERTRIARELHDELGVGLTCLKIDLSRLSTTMASEGAEVSG